MALTDSVQWVELHGSELVGVPMEAAIETLRRVGLKAMVSEFPRPADFPSPAGDRVYLYVNETRMVEKIEAQ